MAFILVCDSNISLNSAGEPQCSTGWVQQLNYAPFQISDIDPAVATTMFGSGFVLFVVPWAAAWGVAQMFKLLK